MNELGNTDLSETSDIEKTAIKYESSVVTITGYKPIVETGNVSLPLLGDVNMPRIGGKTTMGTGFVVSKDGEILTNKHVVNDDSIKYRVSTRDGKRYLAEKIYKDPENDVAVIKITPDTEMIPMELGSDTDISTGEEVASFGTAKEGIEDRIKTGFISGKRSRILTGGQKKGEAKTLKNVIQTNLKLVPGNSGSPLIDGDGKVIGINTAKALTYRDIGFAISIDTAKKFLNSIK